MTNQWPMRKTLACGSKHCLGGVHQQKDIDRVCVDRWGVDGTIDEHLAYLNDWILCALSDLIDGRATLTGGWSVD